MDRLGLTTIGQGRTLTRKVGAAVISVRRGGAVTVYDELNRFMLGSGMIVPGSTYWNFGIGEMPGEVYGRCRRTAEYEGFRSSAGLVDEDCTRSRGKMRNALNLSFPRRVFRRCFR